MDTLWGPLVLFVLIALYVLPALVAASRHHRQTMAITVLNVLLGWTLLGWAGALVWSCTNTGAVVSREEMV
jgi:hypothetical protein